MSVLCSAEQMATWNAGEKPQDKKCREFSCALTQMFKLRQKNQSFECFLGAQWLHSMLSHSESTAIDVTGRGMQSLLQLKRTSDDETIHQQQFVACEDCSLLDDPEAGPRTASTSQGAQSPSLTEHPSAPKRRNSEHQCAIVHFVSC